MTPSPPSLAPHLPPAIQPPFSIALVNYRLSTSFDLGLPLAGFLAGAVLPRRVSDDIVVYYSAQSLDTDASGEHRRGWDALFRDTFQGAVRRWSQYASNYWLLTFAGTVSTKNFLREDFNGELSQL